MAARHRAWRPPLLTLLLQLGTALLLWVACSGPVTCSAQRVRKEIRNLTPEEKAMYVHAINTMISVPMAAGQRKYGKNYRDFLYFVIKHAVTANDPRGDQAHSAPCFMTFHRAFLLEIERAVLSIVPGLKALPYWDLTRDVRGGDIGHLSPNYAFSGNWFGSINGDPKEKYAVTNGLFPKQPVLRYATPKGFENTTWIFKGARNTGLIRDLDDDNANPFVTRYPSEHAIGAMWAGTDLLKLFFIQNPEPNELSLNYRAADWWFCTDARVIRDWVDWSTCTDVTTLYSSGAMDEDVIKLARVTRAPLLHPSPHWVVGGMTKDGFTGDFTEAAASPNDFGLFLVHHTNIDRNNMIWQANALMVDPTLAERSWGYPADKNDYPAGYDGCWRDDVISAHVPFTDIFPGVTPANATGFTHAEVLALTAPGEAPYTYEHMTPPRYIKVAGRRFFPEDPVAILKWPKFYKQGKQ